MCIFKQCPYFYCNLSADFFTIARELFRMIVKTAMMMCMETASFKIQLVLKSKRILRIFTVISDIATMST